MFYYSHHIGDYRRDTSHLSLLEHGIYRQMLDQYYLDEKPICADDAKLMRSLCARSADEIQSVKNVLKDFFLCTEDGYVHKRCDIEIEGFHAKSKSASESAKARWERLKGKNHANASVNHANALNPQCDGNANHKPITNNQEPVTNEPVTINPESSKKGGLSKGSRLSPEWMLPKIWGEWALEQGYLSADHVRLQAEKFRDYWIAQPGAKGRKVDWYATWRNWIRNSESRSPTSGSPKNGGIVNGMGANLATSIGSLQRYLEKHNES
jgi:uncharacterized protein YdaU (DUF1376 family)